MFYLDLLKRKLKEIRKAPKIKIPEALKEFRKRKNNHQLDNENQYFPDIQKSLERIKSLN